MADEKSGTESSSSAGKRSHATLDLKATEVNVAPAKAGGTAASSSAASGDISRPASARSCAEGANGTAQPKADPQGAVGLWKNDKTSSSAPDSAASAPKSEELKVVVQKRSGFFNHLAAGVLGGVLAFGVVQLALRPLGLSDGSDEQIANLSQRVAMVEKNERAAAPAPDLSGIHSRIANLENTTQKIPLLVESQVRLVAETKAALASAASDAGSPQLIERIGKVEDRLKAMADADIIDPNAKRIEQIAALTGKVSDLERRLSTQLTALRTSVVKDAESRIQSVMEASEAARAGTQRIDKDVAGLKADSVRMEREIAAIKLTTNHAVADLRIARNQIQSLKSSLDNLNGYRQACRYCRFGTVRRRENSDS